MAIIVSVVLSIVLLSVGWFVFTIIQPKLVFLFDTLVPKYIPCVAVSASIDGITYSEENLKRIPRTGHFFLKFDVSIKRRGLYWGEKEFDLIVENKKKEQNKLDMQAIEYSCKKDDTKQNTFNMIVSRHSGKASIVYSCKLSPTNDNSNNQEQSTPLAPDILLQISKKIEQKKKCLEPLDKTIALISAPGQTSSDGPDITTIEVSIKGELSVKIENQEATDKEKQ
jgi:hypothetical protein